MGANFVFLMVLAASLIGAIALTTASVRLGLRWAKIADVSWPKAFGLYVLFVFVTLLLNIVSGVLLFAMRMRPPEFALDVIGYAIPFFAVCVTIAMVYKVRLWRAAKATVPYVVVSLAMILFAMSVIRPFAYEGFSVPTNSMAPTILGEHLQAECPNCGQPAYGSPPNPRDNLPAEGMPMVCSKEMKTVFVSNSPQTRHGGDRILACKFIAPRRWDIIVFRYPEDPSVNYVKRLVGLPGEKLEIRDGAVWINSERLEPPESIRGIHYSPTVYSHGQELAGPGSAPVELGPDEYFVLGDFVDGAADSRLWQHGAPGHPPYAVPASHIVGVVINIYWPLDRWTSFR